MIKPTGRALLFDIDGTLTDTDALHLDAFNQVFGPYGHSFDRARFGREVQGFSTASIQQRFLADESPEQQLAVMERKEAVFRDLAAAEIRPLPGLMALLDVADRAGVPMAAVTNAPRLNAEMMLAGLGIADRFAVLVIGDELAHGKPHPLPYLEGLRALGADPKASVAFEDSRAGVQAASAAGIATVGIRTSVGHDDLLAAGAATTANSFDTPELVGWLAERMQW
ncbi:HAD family hydrolase [Rhodopseudomonas sp. P2A-2r]|uniref:HAD family hydrolase n=1 Tax=unclassified Rhodopseudomonas TaxID=2638247 RepID=UPI002234E77F|nr:HAD family phosphatase [Rhodopseudomonas sp. P2A-2r]UZE47146.1 HAD family phosphatase [Rhodopseudomonas sp. P2A-2r]